MYLCELLNDDDKEDIKPAKFLIRIMGGRVLSKEDEATTFGLMKPSIGCQTINYIVQAMRGEGPKIYGVFEGGRIEEFIQSWVLIVKALII